MLAGCAPEIPAPPSPPASATPESSASPTPGGGLIASGSADENLPWFAATVSRVWDLDQSVHGQDYLDALATAGFPKEAIQVTDDRTSVGNPADSIQFAVLWDGSCLIGQVGPSVDGPITIVAPELVAGGCLVGATRDIQW